MKIIFIQELVLQKSEQINTDKSFTLEMNKKNTEGDKKVQQARCFISFKVGIA